MLLIDLSLVDTVDTIDQSLTDRAKRLVRLTCVCFLDPGQVVTIHNVEENRAERYVEFFHGLSVICDVFKNGWHNGGGRNVGKP